ncbi:MAG: hypothetical protein RMK45_04105 [Armatimonadota bacterium]|nr:hypothetical protein [Armatimonadota bacterium]
MPIIQLDLDEEIYNRIGEIARAEGQSVEAWVRRSIQRMLEQSATAEERIKAFLAWVQRYASDDVPPIPLESLRRENLYKDE